MATIPAHQPVPAAVPLPPEVQEMLLEALELAKRVDQRLREQTPPGGQYSAVEIPPVTRIIAN